MKLGDIWTAKHPVYGSEVVVILSGEEYNLAQQTRTVFAAPVRQLVDAMGYSIPLPERGYVSFDSMRLLGRDDFIGHVGYVNADVHVRLSVMLAFIFDLDLGD